MSAPVRLIAATAERAEMPPVVRGRIALFLAAGLTGRIVLHVKEGEVRSYELTEIGDAQAPLDSNAFGTQDTSRT